MFTRDGYLILPSVFSAEEIRLLRAQLPNLFSDRPMNAYENKTAQVILMNMVMAAKGSEIARRYSPPVKSVLYILVTRFLDSSITYRGKTTRPARK